MKNMQNEPNFKNTQIDVSSANKSNYTNFRHIQRRKNEPNFKPCDAGSSYIKFIKKADQHGILLFWVAFVCLRGYYIIDR